MAAAMTWPIIFDAGSLLAQSGGGLDWQFEWAGKTRLHPAAVAVTAVAGAALLCLPRIYAIWPILFLVCFVTSGQRWVIGGLDFTLLRLLIVFGICRVCIRGEASSVRWGLLDVLVPTWLCSAAAIYTFQWGTTSALINRLGIGFEIGGLYIVTRCLLRSLGDLVNLGFAFSIAAVPVAALFILENRTGRNLFAVLGGVPEVTAVREGRLRCQGPFSHPIIAGCFWAAVFPICAIGLRSNDQLRKIIARIGVCACLVIVVLCSSSTPVFGAGVGLVGLATFRIRHYGRVAVMMSIGIVIALHLSMNKPVWHLLGRVSAVGGSTGYHRYKIIDEAINHFSEWWLLGARTVEHWHVWKGDITNEYVLQGLRGGFLTMLLLMTVLVTAFRMVGRAMRVFEQQGGALRLPDSRVAWLFGVAIAVQAACFIGISYFGQIWVVFSLPLAAIALLDERAREEQHSNRPAGAPGGGGSVRAY